MISDLQRSIDDCWDPVLHSSQMILFLSVMQGWMNSWGYANKIPTSVWRGSMTVPRYRCHLLRHPNPEFSKYEVSWLCQGINGIGWEIQSLKDSALFTSQGAHNDRSGWDSNGAEQPCPRTWIHHPGEKNLVFFVIHHQTSRIIKYSSRYNHKQGLSISSAIRKYNPHSGWWRRGWTFLNPRPDVDHQWQFCTSGGNHLVFVCWIIVELWSRQESESINMVDAVNIFEKLYQIIEFQIKLRYNVNRVIHTSNTLHC